MSKKNKKKGEEKQTPAAKGKPARIPFLLDFSLSLSSLLVVLASLLTAGLALLSGASLEVLAFRTGLVLLVSGLLAWLLNWLLARKILVIAQAQMKELLKETRTGSTIEKEA